MICKAVQERKELTRDLWKACNPGREIDPELTDGSEKSLLVTFAVLHGIVNEYLNGGDQMTENCDCGDHVPPEV